MPKREPLDPGKYFFSTLMNDIELGRVRLPPFQREFVWSPPKVIRLMDSIYKGFPIGSFFYWKADRRYVTLFRDIESLSLPKPAPDYELFFILYNGDDPCRATEENLFPRSMRGSGCRRSETTGKKELLRKAMKLSHPVVLLFGAGATRGGLQRKSAPPPPVDTDFFEIAGQIKGHGTPILARTVLGDVRNLYGRIFGIGLENYYRH